jgi:tight adherence protein C
MTLESIYLLCVFCLVFGLGLLATRILIRPAAASRLRGEAVVGNEQVAGIGGWVERIVRLSEPLARLSLPSEGWEHSALRVRFMNAGLRGSAAPQVYFAAKTALAIGLPLLALTWLRMSGTEFRASWLVGALWVVAACGLYLPNVVLWALRRRRERQIFEAFPDAIDLITVCVEAGLGLDAALVRVAQDVDMTSRPLAEELHLVTLELRAGSSKEKALRNLALRCGVEEIDALAAMLIQAERFGTGIAESLRVQSESLRTTRRLRAEEAAAKIPVKMLFPLIFFIFPSMLTVLLGPAVIRISQTLMPTLAAP